MIESTSWIVWVGGTLAVQGVNFLDLESSWNGLLGDSEGQISNKIQLLWNHLPIKCTSSCFLDEFSLKINCDLVQNYHLCVTLLLKSFVNYKVYKITDIWAEKVKFFFKSTNIDWSVANGVRTIIFV